MGSLLVRPEMLARKRIPGVLSAATKTHTSRPSRVRPKNPIGAPTTNRVLSSKYTDGETGLVYYGQRYYSPGMGRWVSRDPIGEEGGRNIYTFTLNNPLLLVDAVGLSVLEMSGSRTGTIHPDWQWHWQADVKGAAQGKCGKLMVTVAIDANIESGRNFAGYGTTGENFLGIAVEFEWLGTRNSASFCCCASADWKQSSASGPDTRVFTQGEGCVQTLLDYPGHSVPQPGGLADFVFLVTAYSDSFVTTLTSADTSGNQTQEVQINWDWYASRPSSYSSIWTVSYDLTATVRD
jgi:RHS repeat-associated protein